MPNGIKINGMADLERKLKALGSETIAKRVLRKAIRAGVKPILSAARANVPVESGALKKSLANKVKVNKSAAYGLVGPATDYVGENGQRPSKYAHLVEYGHVSKTGQVIPPHPFIRTTADESLSGARDAYAEKLAAEIEAEASKA